MVQRNFEKDKILAVSYEARELGIKRKNCTVDQAKEKARDKNVELQIFRVAEYRNGRPNLGWFPTLCCKLSDSPHSRSSRLELIKLKTIASKIPPIFEKSI